MTIMESLTKEQIKEIAEQLDCGFRCFWHKKNGEFLFVPDTLRYPDIDMDTWTNEMEKLDNNFMDYREIAQLDSTDSFEIMTDFVETLSDSNRLKDKLIVSLNKKKPFREFKFAIDNSGEFRQKWFDFKHMRIQDWVKERFAEISTIEE